MTYYVGSNKQVFINWDLIEPGYGVAWKGERPTSREMPYGIQLRVNPPRLDKTPIIQSDRPWETFINCYATMFEDDGIYRLYYESYYREPSDEPSDLTAMLSYAESTDGVNWVKPELGQVEFKGSKANNIVYALDVSRGRGSHGGTVFKDPSAAPEERYKLIHMGRENGVMRVFGATSPDGIRWTAIEKHLIDNYMSDTQTIVRYDADKGKYVGYFRAWRGYEAGKWHGRRAIAYAETEDFRNWPRPEIIVEPNLSDAPEVDIYTNGYSLWPGTNNAHLMFPAFYQRTYDVTQTLMYTSRDGIHWDRPQHEPIIPAGEPGTGWEGGVYAGCGLVSLNPGEVSLLVGPKWHTHNEGHYPEGRPEPPPDRGHLALATWRQDGFMALEAESLGSFTTAPMVFEGSQLKLNAWTRFGGEIRVEVIDPEADVYSVIDVGNEYLDFNSNSNAAEGYTLNDCEPFTGDSLEHIVKWNGTADLSQWAGQPIRLRFWMRRARLFSLQFV